MTDDRKGCPGSQMGPCGKTDQTFCGIRFCPLVRRRPITSGFVLVDPTPPPVALSEPDAPPRTSR